MLQEHVKTTQTDKTRFFFAKKKCYTTNNCSIKSHFNQANIERKNCVWTTSRLLEMCIVEHVEMKSVFTFQPIIAPVSTTVKSAKPAATFWIFLFRTKIRQLYWLVVTLLIVLQKKSSRDYEKKTISFFEEISQPITNKHIRKWSEKGQIKSKHGIDVSVSYWLTIWAIYSFSNHFVQFQSTVNLPPTYTKSSWSSQSPTTESNGLLILVPTLLLLQ